MKNPIAPLLILLCCFATACHRPYALYQRTATQTFRSPSPTPATSVVDSTGWAALVSDSTQPATAPAPVAYASAWPAVPTASRPSRVIESLTQPVTSSKAVTEQMQPRPKPRARSEPQRKTLREVLGLQPRKKLNGWQRISWKLKAAVVVILIAVAFALLKITILAVLFGLIGAYLLIKGLKKSFRVRRPIF